jgi:bacterioferritin B
MPPAPEVTRLLNEQIGNEFAAHQQYVACAVFFDADTLPQLARFFYAQALEEREHAMMIVQYLLDTGADVTMPGVAAPQVQFEDVVAPIRLALEQEQRVTEQILGIARAARDAGDYTTEQFLQWFIKEQTEEVATMGDLLRMAERTRGDVLDLEEYVAREHAEGEGEDPTAPHVAGASG